MFHTHNPIIREYAQTGPLEVADVARFVIATIQQSIEHTPEIAHEFRHMGAASKYAFGWKGPAIDWHNENARRTHADAMAIYRGADCERACEVALTEYFASLPGLGLAKGGFMVQLCFGLSGCLDSHNLARFGIAAGPFQANAFKALRRDATRRQRAADYVNHVHACGGPAGLWDSWCDYVADLRPATFESGFHVSSYHVAALDIPPQESIPF